MIRRALSRGYATHRPSTNKLNGILSLDQFIQRGRVISLYRTILRGTKNIGDSQIKAETRRHARDEFERHRQVTDVSKIRYLLSTGKTEWERMERYIEGL